MTLLDRYLGRQVIGYTLLVMAVLLSLSALFLFLGQQDDVGTGTYGMGDAVLFTFLQMPQQFVELLPIGALLGSLLGLGNLARGSELVVIRASGVSVARVGLTAALAGLVLALAGAAIGEFLGPPLEAYAKRVKTFGKFSELKLAGDGGAWVKEGDRFVSIRQQSALDTFGGIFVYTFEERADGRALAAVGRADRATLVGPDRWRLDRFAESTFAPDGSSSARRADRVEVESGIDPAFLGLAVTDPSSLTARGLVRYVAHLRENGLDSRAYEAALWSRLARAVATVLLCALAVPFVFGPLRSSGAGSRLVIGILLGVVFFLVSRTLENSGQVYGLDPLVVAWAPVAGLALLVGALVARTR